MKFDINEMRKLAGLPIVEGYDEDDDGELSQAERELVKKADSDLAKKGTKVDDFDPDEEKPAKKAEKPEAKKEEKTAPKKEDKPAGEKKERKPRAENPSKKASQVRAHLNANPDMSRGQFIAYVMDKLGMTKAGANTYYYKFKAKKAVAEGYILVHPGASSFVLAENKMMNQYQWVDGTSDLEPLVFESEAEAKKIAKYMSEYKFQTPIVEAFMLGEDEE